MIARVRLNGVCRMGPLRRHFSKKRKKAVSLKGMVNLGGIKPNGVTKKFYKQASIKPMDDGFTVCLDGRPLVTEEKRKFVVPNATVASAVAYEWDVQGEYIKPFVMPMMSLAATAIDVDREKIIAKLLSYIDTDAMCYRVDSPSSLARMQKKYWDPILNYYRDNHDMEILTTEGITALTQPMETKTKLAEFIDKTDKWELAAIKSVSEVGCSTMLGIAVAHRKVSLKGAYNASMAERLYQIKRWGEVEGPYGHGVELEYPRLHISSAITMLNMIDADFAPYGVLHGEGAEEPGAGFY